MAQGPVTGRRFPVRKEEEEEEDAPAASKKPRLDHGAGVGSETVRRQRPLEVEVDIAVAAALSPDERARWLSLALDMVRRGQARPSDAYDVLVHPRFAVSVSPSLARRMLDEIQRHLALFPEKPKRVLESGEFPLAKNAAPPACPAGAAARAPTPAAASAAAQGGAPRGARAGSALTGADVEAMMARCVEFVRRNEGRIADAHKQAARTVHVQVERGSLQIAWGFAWARAAFEARRRVLEGIVDASPAGWLNAARAASGERPLQPGDELVAVNGLQDWDAMANIRNLLKASLTFSCTVEPAKTEGAAAPEAGARAGAGAKELTPPAFSKQAYPLETAEAGWRAHTSGHWLYSLAEEVYFHVQSSSLFMEDPSRPGSFTRLSDAAAAEAEDAGAETGAGSSQLLGIIRWFSKAKGFGFLTPWAAAGSQGAIGEESIFVHKSQLLDVGTEGGADGGRVVPGMPVRYSLGVNAEDGKFCATSLCEETDLASLCSSGTALSSAARAVDTAPVVLKNHAGKVVTGCFAGLVTGRRGMEGAEFIALRLTKHLKAALEGREQGGEKGASAALAVCVRQMQHTFLQYSQRLSKNSAAAWLAAETTACAALVFGPDSDKLARVMLVTVGGGRAIVARRDGTVAACIGGGSSSSRSMPSAASKPKSNEDNLKTFERGLKGPAISFPQWSHTMPPVAEPRGFGAHAWNRKEGGAAELKFDVESCSLEWDSDAFLVLASDNVWESLAAGVGNFGATHTEEPEQQAARIVHAELLKPPSDDGAEAGAAPRASHGGEAATRAARRLLQASCTSRRRGGAGGLESLEGAVTVLRFAWCPLEAANPELAEAVAADAPAPVAAANGDGTGVVAAAAGGAAATPGLPAGEDVEDMFAAPAVDARDSAHGPSAIDDDDMFAAPAVDARGAAHGPVAVLDDDMFAAAPPAQASAPELASSPGAPGPVPSSPPAGAAGPLDEMDDMFADFCREVNSLPEPTAHSLFAPAAAIRAAVRKKRS